MTAPKLRLVQQRGERAADKSVRKSSSRKKAELGEHSAKDAAQPVADSASAASGASSEASHPPRERSSRKQIRAVVTASDFMSSPALCCRASDTLNTAAHLLWENNVGALVVVNEAHEPISMITDRDICFAAYTQGIPLWSGSVASAMAPQIVVCRSDASVSEVRELMRSAKVRRLPIVDASGKLVGIVGMADLCRFKPNQKTTGSGTTAGDVMQLLSAWVSPAP